MNKRTRVLTILIATILSLSVAFVPADTDAAKKYYLPTSVKHTSYWHEYKSDENNTRYVTGTRSWIHKYKYDEYGHIITKTIKLTGTQETKKYKWKYKNKKPIQMLRSNRLTTWQKKVFGKKGRLKKVCMVPGITTEGKR